MLNHAILVGTWLMVRAPTSTGDVTTDGRSLSMSSNRLGAGRQSMTSLGDYPPTDFVPPHQGSWSGSSDAIFASISAHAAT
jgi:hypothetical protein